MPKVSIVVPIYQMSNAIPLLERNLKSVYIQSFDDYEIVISDDSKTDELEEWIKRLDLPIRYFRNLRPAGMANNTNNAIDQSMGELVKILFQDDYFYDSRCLERIVKHFTPQCWWLATGCTHTLNGFATFNPHKPYYSESENTIGSPSVITFRREVKERFDPNFKWVLDLDWYRRLYRAHGKPKIFDQINVVIGIGDHQETHKLTDERKIYEHNLLKIKYEAENALR